MFFSAHTVPYHQTQRFSKLVLDYLAGAPALQPFYSFAPSLQGVQQATEQKKKQRVDRELLVAELTAQYKQVTGSTAVQQNIQALLSPSTFTVCTAHQPNLFTGPLYFIYKIMHAIKLADVLNEQLPQHHFVPVYYMGSEDADLAELNHFYVEGKRYEWQTNQTGAVGRMRVDDLLLQLINDLEGQLNIYPFGKEIISLLRKHFAKGAQIQDATFGLVNDLFASFGLIVLNPDNANLKRVMLPVFEEELFQPVSSALVEQTSQQLAQHYTVQAHPREINLFYLKDHLRERIIKAGNEYVVHNTELRFSADELKEELHQHPERFSPNVILRGLFQETILPNIAFIGGGGELAYWLQLKALFHYYNVVYPVLVLRNSFLIVEEKWQQKIKKLGFAVDDLFLPKHELMNRMVLKNADKQITLNGKMEKAEELFAAIQAQAESIDPTLSAHVAAIKTRSLKTLKELEKKMLRAEKRKYETQQRQLAAIQEHLFPGKGLQERRDSFLYGYATAGQQFLQELYRHSGALEQQFTVLQAQSEPLSPASTAV